MLLVITVSYINNNDNKFIFCCRKNPKHFEEFAHPSLKSPVNDDDDDLDTSAEKMNSPPSGGRQKRAAALKQKGVVM